MKPPVRLGIIGCGAATEIIHLRAAKIAEAVNVCALVDRDLARARQLAERYGVPEVFQDYRDVFGRVDAALVAVPHNLHASVSLDLLEQGIHVLVEKPMALCSQDCDRMIQSARDTNALLAVGLIRRFFQTNQFVKEVLESKLLGPIRSFDYREGLVYVWKVKTDAMFRKESGGGVLADTGGHALDTLLWWLGDCESFEYYDDAAGGVETDCHLELKMRSGVRGVVEMSRIRNLRNTCIFEGERGTLEVEVGTSSDLHVNLRLPGRARSELSGHARKNGIVERPLRALFRQQIENFAAAIREGRSPAVSGAEARRSAALIEACYAARRVLSLPWMAPGPGDKVTVGESA